MNRMSSMKSTPLAWLIVLMLFIPFTGKGQIIDSFPADSSRFIQTLSDYLEKRISQTNQEQFELFKTIWETGKFDASKRDSIISICNALLDNNANREPHFTGMIRLMNQMNGTTFDSRYFNTWMKGFNHLMRLPKRKLPKVSQYFDFSREFIESKALYLSRARDWYASGDDYHFVYDTTIKVVYDQTNLKCRHRRDSMLIYQTGGSYYPFKKLWQGQGGKVTWQRAGYSENDIYVRLDEYRIDLTKAEYRADSVRFINKLYFDQPIMGELHDKLHHIINPGDALFPVFSSYKKVFRIPGIYKNMDYTGGFRMKGAQFIGSGEKGKDAKLEIHRDGKIFMTAQAQVFILRKNKALSRKAAITIHLGQDSIYHNGISFNYHVKNQEIELIPNDNILSKSVYYNTYHQVSMKFDRLLWNTNEDKIYFTRSRNSSMGKATFTSMNYFTLNKWLQLELRDRVHPLIAIRNYHNQVNNRRFDAGEFAKYMELPTYQVRQRLMHLATDGFLFYNLDSDTITINDKLFDYIKARIGKIDYDVIRINSNTTSTSHNAVLDLSSMNMRIKGVDRTFVSDSQNVVFYPDRNGLIMKKNRNFEFGGVVLAGLFTFFGDSLSFSYEDFSLTMNKIDSLRMRYRTDEFNQYGQKILANVENTVSDLSGILYIDHPNNKSGKLNFPKYPLFESQKNSFVYYDDLFNGPYKKDEFYFKLYPFTMDSLDNFKPAHMKFEGTFHSADIFPPFEDTLKLRGDNSLGFTKTTDNSGLPLYEGKGTYYKKIDMSNKGLRGDGELTFLTARARTDDILFFPDSTSIHASHFTIGESTTGIQYPEVASQEVDIQWYPHDNNMHIWQTNQPFTMFNGKSFLQGYINLKPTGLTGTGTLDMKKGALESPHYDFEAQSFDADTANFKLRTLDSTAIAFQSDTLKAHVDYDYQRARFRTLKDYSISEFPQNLYQGYLDEFVWRLDEDELEIESTPNASRDDELSQLRDPDLRGALYLSTHKGQDSLRFASPQTTFRLSDTTMVAEKVKYLNVADARVFPNEQTLKVQSHASIDTMRQARLLADHSKDNPHEIFNASLKVNSRHDYRGYGDYEYTGQDSSSQTIHFSTIAVDDSLNTFANGQIAIKDSFTLSPYFRYAGKVNLSSRRELLKFKGSAKMIHRCKSIRPRFTSFESTIEPMDVQIPVGKNNTDIKGNKIFVGPYVTIDSTHLYSTFLTPRKDASDDLLLSSQGYLNYDPENDRYEIASRSRLQKKEQLSPYIALDRKACHYQAEGKMNLGVDFGELEIDPVGKLKHNLSTNEITMNLTLPVKFHFSPAALDSMARDLKNRRELTTADTGTDFFRHNLYQISGKSPANQYLKTINAPDSLKDKQKPIPSSLDHSLLFSNVQFKWNTASNSYIAKDDIHLAMINGKPVNKVMDGYIEIVKQKFGDKLYIYLTPDDENYYFFYYFRRMMRTGSTNRDFVKAIDDVPNRKRKITRGLGNTTYRYILSTETSFSRFRKHMSEMLKEMQTSDPATQTPEKKDIQQKESEAQDKEEQ